jgi:hypothetical protein
MNFQLKVDGHALVEQLFSVPYEQVFRGGLFVRDYSFQVADAEGLADRIRALTPRDDSQRWLQARAGEAAEELLESRWLAFAGSEASVPGLFLVVILFWLTITFVSFGLLATRNATIITVLFVCAVCVGSALFLILEMDRPFDGLLSVSADPLRYAHAHINQ